MREDGKKYTSKVPGVFCAGDLLSKVGGNLFQLVRIAANRALELDAGKPALIPHSSSDKVTTIALEEIAQGKVAFMNKKLKKEKPRETKKEDVQLTAISS